MPDGPLKKIRPRGETSIECTLVGAVTAREATRENPLRVAFRSIALIVPTLTSPNTRSPFSVPPRPHRSQKAAPVMPIVRGEVRLGLVPGLGARVVRSLRLRGRACLLGPPSEVGALDDQVDLVGALGAVLRLPQAVGAWIEGEPVGVAMAVGPDPSDRVAARGRPVRVEPQDLATEVARAVLRVDALWPSPITTYSLRSGPNRMRPPLWYGSALAGAASRTRRWLPDPPLTVKRTNWFCRCPPRVRVT